MHTLLATLFVSIILFTPVSQADGGHPDAITQTLARIIPGQTADSITAGPLPGLYEVSYGSEIFYLSADGRFLFQGDMVDLTTQTNLTEKKRALGRHALMQDISKDTMIVFAPERTKHVVNVFTDIDCQYCRKLHREISEYTDRGIEIRYLSYPRSGANTPSYFKAVAVWCSDDRKNALTTAKSGQPIDMKSCDNPVDEHMAVADKLGINGTPALLLEDGSLLSGYVPAARLSQYLDSLKH